MRNIMRERISTPHNILNKFNQIKFYSAVIPKLLVLRHREFTVQMMVICGSTFMFDILPSLNEEESRSLSRTFISH